MEQPSSSAGTGRCASARNFVRQQGFREDSPSACDARYPGLMWQPRLMGLLVLAGILLRWWPWWIGLGTVLWWNVLVPRGNPFDLLWNVLVARPRGREPLPPARAPRRFSQGMAGTLMLAIGLAMRQDWTVLAWAIQAAVAVAIVALVLFRFCLGSFLYYGITGQGAYARKTAPWAPDAG